MPITRRTFTSAAAVASSTVLLPRFARAADFNYKYANNLPLSHPVNVRAKVAMDKIREETSGRVSIEIFPNSQLGSDSDVLSQVRSGGVDFFTLAGALLATLVPVAAIDGVPFVFKDYAAVWKAVDGNLGKLIRSEIAKVNLVAMDKQWDNGFHQITTKSTEINSPKDMKGLKIRTGASALQVQMCTALGASPTSISFNELYTALQTGVVDAQLNALVIVKNAKLYEVQKHCALTNHMWSGFWFLANKKSWEKMPENIRAIVASNLNAAAVAERADIESSNRSLEAELSTLGMKFARPDPAPFRAQLAQAGFYRDWKAKFGASAWEALEASVGNLA
ncbi:MAG: TRAP transporter substrate-binding protein [Ottowia sp.]|uniref:TRAP transporter substrate-binding protein n=1 Tax=Ottowia sp. TaxID=1898956 RepID=UPI0039E4095E